MTPYPRSRFQASVPSIVLALFIVSVAVARCVHVHQDDGEPDIGIGDGARAAFLRREGAQPSSNSNDTSGVAMSTIDGYGNIRWKPTSFASASIDVYMEMKRRRRGALNEKKSQKPAIGSRGLTTYINAKERGGLHGRRTLVAYAEAVLGDGPVAYFRFEDDSTVAGASIVNDAQTMQAAIVVGSLRNVTSLLPSEPSSNAFDFGGTGMVAVTNTHTININASGYSRRTVELWFKTDFLTNTENQIMFEEGGKHDGLVIWVKKKTAKEASLSFYVYSLKKPPNFGHPSHLTTMSCDIRQGTKYMAAVVFSSVNRTIYAYLRSVGQEFWSPCGGQIHNLPPHAKLQSHSGGIGIGGVNGDSRLSDTLVTTSGYFQGVIDELAIYNTALTSTELTLHWDAAVTKEE